VPGQNTFPHRERLTRKGEYHAVFQNGTKRVGKAFVCYVARREGQGRKFGFAVSRRVGGAVVRNRVKRYLREIYRAHRTRLAGDIHIVIVARPHSKEIDFHQCAEAMRRLLREHEVLSE